jgi:hypothetical protein
MYAFVHIGKTAGSTMTDALRRSFGPFHCDVEPWRGYNALPFRARDYRWLRLLYPGLRSIAGHTVTPYSDLETVVSDLRYYTVLREPIARAASHYQYHRDSMQKHRTFEEWIHIDRLRNFQCRMIAGEPSASAAIKMIEEKDIFVGLVECFDESLQMLSAWMDGLLCVTYQTRNVASKQDIARSLKEDPASLELLREANQEDAELHRWATQVWMKRQRSYLAAAAPAFSAPGARRASFQLGLHRLHRNLLYKPLLRTAQRLAS